MARNNKKYTIDEKENMIKRMLPPENCSSRQLAMETGISQSTLSTWKSKVLYGELFQCSKVRLNYLDLLCFIHDILI